MMSLFLKIYILGLLAIYVHGYPVEWDIQLLIHKKELIDGVFMPISRDDIGTGSFATVFKGVNMIDNRDVAMKYCSEHSESKHEYEIYSYLNAIDNPEVEKYGISPIYYYNQWHGFTLTVFSLFECSLWQKKTKSHVSFQTIDYLILLRDFVRQSKYLHSRGVRHDDVKPQNIMLRKSRSFLIDFNLSSKMNESIDCHSAYYLSRRLHRHQFNKEPLRPEELRIPLDDWESFLYTISMIRDIKLEWFTPYRFLISGENNRKRMGLMKENTTTTIGQIEKDVKCEHLRVVMVEFAKEAFKEDGPLPRYNDFEKLITKKIEDVIGKDQPAVFSWLEGHERDEAIEDLKNNPPATTEEIDDPKATYLASHYETPDYDYFENRKDAMANKADGNYQRYLKEEDENDLQKQMEQLKLEAENEKMQKKKEKLSPAKKSASKSKTRKHR